MKTFLLTSLFCFFVYAGQACSCIYISDYFCPTASWFNDNAQGTTLYIAQVRVTSIYGYHMDVEVVDNLQNTIPDSEVTILGQDGLNCNEWLGPFSEGGFYILAVYKSDWEEGVYDLNGCGRFWLPVNGGQVEGNISEQTQEQSYAEFKHSVAQCAGLTPAEEPDPAALLLYPNPTSGALFIDGLAPGTSMAYTIYNSHGQLLRAGQVDARVLAGLSLSGLPDGIYLLRLLSPAGKAVLTRRIVLGQD
ncbi:MAG: T9SS type A sorting domain-containing protein [Phaeodactylibacter sp.]|nr:T9SS type A sorting domain-containing protein [Phaeodactylibacter sp.]